MEPQIAHEVVKSTPDYAQWVAILLTAFFFLYRQTKLAGRNEQKQESIKEQIIDIKNSTDNNISELEDSLTSRLKTLEHKAYGNGDGGFITMRQHDRMQNDCQRQLVEQISRNAQLFEELAKKLESMDSKREEVRDKDNERREEDNKRLGKIELAILGIQKDVSHLAEKFKNEV